MTLAEDPRADPRMVAALAPYGLAGPLPPPPLGPTAPLADRLAACAVIEEQFQTVFAALTDGLPAIADVTSQTRTITGADGDDITLWVHEPAQRSGPLPCVVHLHGGGMALLTAADPVYVRWRDALAAAGLVVVGVEFRNAAGKLGCHPFPAGLADCASAVRWTAAHRDELGASCVVVSGESGGGNLALATALKAKREGWAGEIAGVYAQCPYIAGVWNDPPAELPSLRENDGYLLSCALMAILASVYDPEGANAADATCWPLRATADDLTGLPPHAICVNDLDPLRDEGLAYYRMLLDAGVPATSRVIEKTCHGADTLLADALPEVYEASIAEIADFARSL